MVFRFKNFVVDASAVENKRGLDASRWAGRVVLRRARGIVMVTASYAGAEGASEGRLVDVEGASVRACRMVDAIADELAEEIARRLGDPCSPEERRDLDREVAWFDEGGETVGRRAA